ncbi:MAG: elongation factor G [Candidatus Omnitrophica bacterium]|nr:elongation factor G [Candidatus Omnitrophota bacterium]
MAEGRIPMRNVVLLGHSHSGKTQLSEALLCNGGSIPKPGSVTDGTTVSDYNDDEKERKISISSSMLNLTKNNIKVNIIDAPGYGDFIGEATSGAKAADSAVIVVNAVSGVEIGTNKALKLAGENKLPAVIFINKIDKENTDFAKCVDLLGNLLGKKGVVLSYPIGKESSFKDTVNLITKEKIDQLQGDDRKHAEKLAESLVENVAETDDSLLERYLDKGELTQGEVEEALKKAILESKIIPIFAGSATLNIGINELLDFILNEMPSPDEVPPREAINPKTNEKLTVSPKESDFFSAQVFKTISDPYVGQISIFKVFSGKISSNTSIYNSSKKASEKTGQLFTLLGKEHKQLDGAFAGDIACIAKMKNTSTGDSLSTEKKPVVFGEFQFPEPAISFSIKPKTRADEDRISDALHKLTAEDMTFKIIRDPQTKELIASGMGDLHIKIMIARLKNRYGVQVDMGTPKVAYKETITSKGDSHYRHKKQSGGAGQFAEVWMKVEPLPRSTGFEFMDEVVGGAIPGPFIVSCEKGIKAAMQDGVLAGFPMIDLRATVYDGKTHPVDSKDIAFQIAARHGFKEAILKSKPVLLEPIMDVDITIPDEYMGDITGSLNSRRGRIMGIEPGVGMQVIKAQVPLEEMYKWANELKSLTGGRGTYTMRFSHDEVVPSNLAQMIVEKAKKAKEEAKA